MSLYPAQEPDVIDLGQRHYLMEWSTNAPPFEIVGGIWHHDGPTAACSSWGWFGEKDGKESGHRITTSRPMTVEGSLICEHCGDHGFIREGRWVAA